MQERCQESYIRGLVWKASKKIPTHQLTTNVNIVIQISTHPMPYPAVLRKHFGHIYSNVLSMKTKVYPTQQHRARRQRIITQSTNTFTMS